MTPATAPAIAPGGARPIDIALLASVFVVAACGLLYELAAGALASYVLGDSVLQFSTVIGTYLFAMGVGSWLSRYIENHLAAHFLRIELLVALVGGLLPAVLFLANVYLAGAFRPLLYGMVWLVGAMVGLEIPLVMRLLKRNVALKDLVSQVLTFDYLGALAVSLAFPLVLVPQLGLVRTGLVFGLLNASVAVWALWLFRQELRQRQAYALACAGVIAMDMRSGNIIGIPAKTIIIATGGYGRAYWVRTSNPYSSTGDGIVAGMNVGIPFKDPEMVQFHPTGLAVNGVLLSESSRAEGALLINKDGERFMQKYAPEKMELATRDIVARAIATEIEQGRGIGEGITAGVYLDFTKIPPERIHERLGQVADLSLRFATVADVQAIYGEAI